MVSTDTIFVTKCVAKCAEGSSLAELANKQSNRLSQTSIENRFPDALNQNFSSCDAGCDKSLETVPLDLQGTTYLGSTASARDQGYQVVFAQGDITFTSHKVSTATVTCTGFGESEPTLNQCQAAHSQIQNNKNGFSGSTRHTFMPNGCVVNTGTGSQHDGRVYFNTNSQGGQYKGRSLICIQALKSPEEEDKEGNHPSPNAEPNSVSDVNISNSSNSTKRLCTRALNYEEGKHPGEKCEKHSECNSGHCSLKGWSNNFQWNIEGFPVEQRQAAKSKQSGEGYRCAPCLGQSCETSFLSKHFKPTSLRCVSPAGRCVHKGCELRCPKQCPPGQSCVLEEDEFSSMKVATCRCPENHGGFPENGCSKCPERNDKGGGLYHTNAKTCTPALFNSHSFATSCNSGEYLLRGQTAFWGGYCRKEHELVGKIKVAPNDGTLPGHGLDIYAAPKEYELFKMDIYEMSSTWITVNGSMVYHNCNIGNSCASRCDGTCVTGQDNNKQWKPSLCPNTCPADTKSVLVAPGKSAPKALGGKPAQRQCMVPVCRVFTRTRCIPYSSYISGAPDVSEKGQKDPAMVCWSMKTGVLVGDACRKHGGCVCGPTSTWKGNHALCKIAISSG